MFQLRFLLATPRKAAPHIFTHRDYRGQRTSPDDFHPAYNTYICESKGTPGKDGYKSSQDVMLELAQHSAQNNPSSHLFTIVEIWNPENRNRLKLAGDEIILRPSDLAAAQEAFNATVPATLITPPSIGCQISTALLGQYQDLPPEHCLNLTTNSSPSESSLAEVKTLQKLHPEAEITFLERNPDHPTGHYVFATIKKPQDVNNVTTVNEVPSNALETSPEEQMTQGAKDAEAIFESSAAAATENSEPRTENPSVLARVRTEIQTNGKATATQLANTLGIAATAIKDAVNLPDSGLQNKGGWISLIPGDN